MKKTNDKTEYRRAQAILRKCEDRTHKAIAMEHGVNERTVQRWIADYNKKGIEGLKICKSNSGSKPRITDKDREIILSALFNDPHLFGYLRNTWSLRSLASCLTNEIGIQISFKHLQRITKEFGVRCKRPKLELLHGDDYEEGKEKVDGELQADSFSSQKKRVIVAFEDETTITQKPCIRRSMSFKGEQQRIEHNGSRKKFSAYISTLWPEEKLMTYDFYDKMNSMNTIDHLENLKTNIMKNDWWKRLILIWDNASYHHVSQMVRNYINAQKEEWLTVIHLPKKAPYLNPNERRVNQQIKLDVCANRFYNHIEELKDSVSKYLDKRFGRWYNDIRYDT